MQIPFMQAKQFNQMNSPFVGSAYKADAGVSLRTRRQMMKAEDNAKEAEAVRVTISAEAMELSRKAKELDREQQIQNAAEATGGDHATELTDEELYDELVNQIQIWGDAASGTRRRFDHKETKEMAEERIAALTELQKLEELQKSETVKQQMEAQRAAELASMQQEEINKKSSELIMMIESFEDQDEEGDEENGTKSDDSAQETGDADSSSMDGRIGASAAKSELGMIGTIAQMGASGDYDLAVNDQSIRGLLDERDNIYKMNNETQISVKEKIAAMSDYVATLASPDMMREYFGERIAAESDEGARKKLEAMSEYFMNLDMKNEIGSLSESRAQALQKKINARDLRIAHLGSRHLVLAEQREKELQSLFDEDDILRAQGQSGVASRTADVAERLQEKLDDRDHMDAGDDASDEERAEDKTKQNEALDQVSLEERYLNGEETGNMRYMAELWAL